MRFWKLTFLILTILLIIFAQPVVAADTPPVELGFYAYPLDYIRVLQYEFSFPEIDGMLVTRLNEVSVFARAGMRNEDVISEVNGQRVNKYEQIQEIVNQSRGSTVTVTVYRLSPRYRHLRRQDPLFRPRSIKPYNEIQLVVEIPSYTPPKLRPVLEGVSGELYHAFGLKHSPDTSETRVFESRAAAEQAGLAPCAICFKDAADFDHSEVHAPLEQDLTEDLIGVGITYAGEAPVYDDLRSRYGFLEEIPEDMRKIADHLFKYRIRTYIQPEIVYVDTNRVYGFGLEKGKLVISRGLWQLLETQEEKAFQLAHVLAHVDLRHHLSPQTKYNFFELMERGLEQAAGSRVWRYARRLQDQLAEHFLGISFSEHGYSSSEESEALCVALINLYRAGYSFEGLQIYYDKTNDMRDDLNTRWVDYLLHHPLGNGIKNDLAIRKDKIADIFEKGTLPE